MRASEQIITVLGGAGISYDPAALAIFAAFTSPPTITRKKIINNLVVSLKASGIWTQLDLLYLLAAADSQAARINWVNPGTFTALAVNSPSFTADQGFTGDGSTSRLRTQFTPSTQGVNFTQNNASLWVWSRTLGQSGPKDIGNNSVNPTCGITIRNTTDQMNIVVNDGTPGLVSNTNSIGFFGADRPSSAIKRAWANGAQLGTDFSVVSVGLPTQEQMICGANATAFSARQEAAAAWGASLAGLEIQFYSAVLAYMQAVGAA